MVGGRLGKPWFLGNGYLAVRHRVPCTIVGLSLLLILGAVFAVDSAAQSEKRPPQLTDQYCISCHSDKTRTAGVSLQNLDSRDVAGRQDLWETVLRKLRAGEMPPSGMPRPDAAALTAFTASLQSTLDRYAAEHPAPGCPIPHRLTRVEYGNAVRDLLGLDIDVTAMLPPDDGGAGFDNVGDVLSITPLWLEKYLVAAQEVSTLAVGDLARKPRIEPFFPLRDPINLVNIMAGTFEAAERASEELPADSRGGVSFKYYFPLDANYKITIYADGPATNSLGKQFDLNLPLKAGTHTIGVTFMREDYRAEPVAVPPPPVPGNPQGESRTAMDVRIDGSRVQLYEYIYQANEDFSRNGIFASLAKVVVSGPFSPTGKGVTPSRTAIFSCHPSKPEEESPCARQIVSRLARRAYRRPATASEINALMALYEHGRADRDFEEGVRFAIESMLSFPQFLFRAEADAARTPPGSVRPVSDLDLASRLSFFLWSSIPDDELLALAEKGKLHEPAVLDRQVRRMLDDERSDSLVTNFAQQWFHLRKLDQAKPDIQLFPKWGVKLKTDFQTENKMLVSYVLRQNRSVLELATADYAFLNQRLAEFYGIPGVYGTTFRRVSLANSPRRGVIGEGGVLAITSYPTRTSVVKRGQWVLATLLGTPPPPPPPNVPPIDDTPGAGTRTLRERMEQHRANPACASCHSRMDPLGFALENFDATGAWREKDGASSIDAVSTMADGTKLSGPMGLVNFFDEHRQQFAENAASQLLTYALGRRLDAADQPAVRAIARSAASEQYRFQDLVAGVVRSAPFLLTRKEDQ